MTWDPRDLGAPRRIANPPAPPEPPAPPPRSYELQLADWDDRRLTAERAGLAFREPLPEPCCEADEPLCAAAVEAVLQRDIFKMLYGKRRNAVAAGELKRCMIDSVEVVRSVLVSQTEETEEHAQERKDERLSAPFTIRVSRASPINDAMLRYLKDSGHFKTVDLGDTSPAALGANHRALVERPMQTLRDTADAIRYGLAKEVGPVDPTSWSIPNTEGVECVVARGGGEGKATFGGAAMGGAAMGGAAMGGAAMGGAATFPGWPLAKGGNDYRGADQD